ncbi:N-acetylmuramoyl-L-alanine amidase [Peribacillus cavernae]|nr:N-acetylmuramoyl-L-alanine amidase [Peribacillus cavernae]MDQ0219315.1 N-acetylmuramoyl-L-alanine amidase [Peribacillus cavernae]
MRFYQKGSLFLTSLLLVGALHPLGDAKGAGKDELTVKGKVLNVRKGPDISSPVVDVLLQDKSYPILKEDDEWIKVKTGTGKEGWVAKWLTGEENSGKKRTIGKGRIISGDVRVRTGPDTSYNLAGSLKKGSKVEILEQQGTWAYIQTKKVTGWIAEKFISQESITGTEKTEVPAHAVLADTVNVRTHASLQGEVLGKIAKGSKVKIITVEGDWMKVSYKSAYGWINKDYLRFSSGQKESETPITEKPMKGEVVIKQNGTNLRSRPDVQSVIVSRTYVGERFSIIAAADDWYKIRLESGGTAYVAGWVVTPAGDAPQMKKQGAEQYLSDKLIVIDPGHGGRDRGTKGINGTLEKNLTLQTALLLQDKLEAAGAAVILTRNTDYYLALPSRAGISNNHNADAFISLHYDHAKNHLVSGVTTYYYHAYQKSLAASLNQSLGSSLQVVNRGYRFGDFHVIRENEQAAALVELGYLSNAAEESHVTSNQYQEAVSEAIFMGLEKYFQ